MSRRPRHLVPCLVLLVAGCFSEPTVVDVDDGTSTGSHGGCSEGVLGCACYGNGTCDAGLSCDAGISVCIPTACTPGTRACTCDDGQCDAPLSCEGGLCRDASHSTVDGSSSDDAGDGSSAGDSTGTSSSGGVDGTEDGTPDDSGGSEGPDPGCDAMACDDCFACSEEPGGGCVEAHAGCADTPGCASAVACLSECGLTGVCFENCCAGLDAAQLVAVDAVMFCRKDACIGACAAYELPTCG